MGPDISDFSFLRLKQKFDWFSDICFSQEENTANYHIKREIMIKGINIQRNLNSCYAGIYRKIKMRVFSHSLSVVQLQKEKQR